MPGLAAELPKLVSPTVWEFKLRRGVKFHNGEPFDAEAVKFSLERMVDRQAEAARSHAVGAHQPRGGRGSLTVRIHTKAPWPILDTHWCSARLSILPPKYYRGKDMRLRGPEPRRHRARSSSCAG